MTHLTMSKLEEKIRSLPPEAQRAIEDLVDLLSHQQKRIPRKLKLDWVGAAKELDQDKDSVELQHEISRWRAESCDS